MRHSRTHRLHSISVAGILIVAAAGSAHAQWTVVNLHPADAPSSEARGVRDGQQVGIAGELGVVWSGTAESAVILNPTPGQGAAANCVQTAVQGGRGHVPFDGLWRSHAGLWTGTAKSFMDLNPEFSVASEIAAMHGDTQVGLWFAPSEEMFSLGRACLWHGTVESFVDLTPPGFLFSEARGVHGDQQVGGTFDKGLPHACMWTGTPESYVALQPPEGLFSIAQCTDGVHQYGLVLAWDGEDFATVNAQVGRWSGTADSWVNMTPKGLYGGIIAAADGDAQVGATAADVNGNPPFRAALWSGTAESYVDLHPFLPLGYTESQALGIWHDAEGTAYIVGSAFNSEMNRTEAVMWVSTGLCRADFNGDGSVNSQDFFDFLAVFFESDASADFNADLVVNSQDFFDFLAAFFGPC